MLLGILNSSPRTYKKLFRSWSHDSQSSARQNSHEHKLKQKMRKFFLRVGSGSGEVPLVG